MTVKDVLDTWDRVFPKTGYPESWAIKMWCQRYTAQEFEHAAQVTVFAAEEGRISDPDIPRYLSGVLRKNKIENAEVEDEIKKHIAAQRGGDVYISI
jgi:hypothetical protein